MLLVRNLGEGSMADFIALDFETANGYRVSACAAALVIFENGRISKEYHWLIRPPRKFDYFHPFNTRLHGISSRDVADKPQFDELWPEIFSLINNETLAAHNASFDLTVLRQLLDIYNLRYPDLEFLCTCNIARRTWGQLASYSLSVVASYLGYRFNHHNALDDAEICGKILIEACTYHECASIHELAVKIGMSIGILNEDMYCPCSVSNPSQSMKRECDDKRINIGEYPRGCYYE